MHYFPPVSYTHLPDTVGYAEPEELKKIITYLRAHVDLRDALLSVHCHNDLGLAVANTLAAIQAGAGQAECALNGIGERAGNAALEEIVMNLKTRNDFYGADTRIDTTQIINSSKLLEMCIRDRSTGSRSRFRSERIFLLALQTHMAEPVSYTHLILYKADILPIGGKV